MVQLSHPYTTTGETIALTRQTFGKVMSLLLNMLSRGGSREELPHVQGAVAVCAQESGEELLHVEGQERRL